LTKAPARFFDITPIGRILNRFTSDINTVDGALQNSARSALSGALNFLASFLVIVVVIPGFAPIALVITWLYFRLVPPYISASRDTRRLELVTLSLSFAGYDELLRGLAHVRAFGMETRYQDRFYRRVDRFQSFDHAYVRGFQVNVYNGADYFSSGLLPIGSGGDMTVCAAMFTPHLFADRLRLGLGSVVVFLTTIFTLWQGASNGSTAIVIVQAGIFAEASRQLVRFVVGGVRHIHVLIYLTPKGW
jgi:ABC-type multidrug transport system fused ATPase/permease subunit